MSFSTPTYRYSAPIDLPGGVPMSISSGANVGFAEGEWEMLVGTTWVPLNNAPDDVVSAYVSANVDYNIGTDLSYSEEGGVTGIESAEGVEYSSSFSVSGLKGYSSDYWESVGDSNTYELSGLGQAIGTIDSANISGEFQLVFDAPEGMVRRGNLTAYVWGKPCPTCGTSDGTVTVSSDPMSGLSSGMPSLGTTFTTETQGGDGVSSFGDGFKGKELPRITVFQNQFSGDPNLFTFHDQTGTVTGQAGVALYQIAFDEKTASLAINVTPTVDSVQKFYYTGPGGSGELKWDKTAHTLTIGSDDGVTGVWADEEHPTVPGGRLISYTDKDGRTTEVDGWTGMPHGGLYPTSLSSTYIDPATGSSITDELSFTFYTSSPSETNPNRVTGSIFKRNSQVLRTVEYTYQEVFDWETATTYNHVANIRVYDGTTSAPILDESYYRWDSNSRLQLIMGKAAVQRASAALGYGQSLSDASLEFLSQYADGVYTYDGAGRVTYLQAAASGIGCGCGIGNEGVGISHYVYDTETPSHGKTGRNAWTQKIIQYLPDDTNPTNSSTGVIETSAWNDNDKIISYVNDMGQPLLVIRIDTSSGAQESTWYQYDTFGQQRRVAHPSAITGYSKNYGDLVNYGVSDNYISDSAGLIEEYEYGTADSSGLSATVAGDVARKLKAKYIRNGDAGTRVIQASYSYYKVSIPGGTTVYPLATQSVYPVGVSPSLTAYITTYSYTWYTGTTQMKSQTVTKPAVASTKNGSNSATSETTYFDLAGNPVWFVNAAGYITYYKYSSATGALIQEIVDVNPTTISSPAVSAPTRSGSLPTALNLTTTYEVDTRGRTTKVTDPNGSVTYTVYNDAEDEVRTYPGFHFDGSTYRTTGPITISRMYYPGTPTDEEDENRVVYSEVLQVQVNPAVNGSGVPTGAETFTSSNIVSLSRSFTNKSGQVVRIDNYHSLTGITYSRDVTYDSVTNAIETLGAKGTNYYSTFKAYDEQGRLAKTVSGTGTITRDVMDAFGRRVSTWIGTDDIPASGAWSPVNLTGTNMVKVAAYEYDDTGTNVGNGNIIKAITYLDGSGTNARYVLSAYDWRNRLISTKTSNTATTGSENTNTQSPLITYEYDNLGNVLATRQYDGDQIALTTNAAAFDSSNGSLLRSYVTSEYDELGRVYRSRTYYIDPTTGSNSYSAYVEALSWFDARGNLMASKPAVGAMTKYSYDGAGRLATQYATDGYGDSSYADRGNVTGDYVIEQIEYTYDAAGNVILQTNRQRFHDAPLTGGSAVTGSLASHTAWARTSYQAFYYDLANRLTASLNVGTYGGSSFTRPSEVPDRSDTELITSYEYDVPSFSLIGTWSTIATDPKGIATRTYMDLLGRTVRTVEAYTVGINLSQSSAGGEPSGSTTASTSFNRRTDYTYDGSGHLTSMTVYTPVVPQGSDAYLVVTDLDYVPASVFTNLGGKTLVFRGVSADGVQALITYLYDTGALVSPLSMPDWGLISAWDPAYLENFTKVVAIRNYDVFSSADPTYDYVGGILLNYDDVIVKRVWIGDFNWDGIVNSLDFDILEESSINHPSYGNGWEQGDANSDGVVDLADFDIWQAGDWLRQYVTGVMPLPAPVGTEGALVDVVSTLSQIHQTTEYIYGVVAGSGANSSWITSNDLLREVRYPDPTTGDASWTDVYNVSHGYAGSTEFYAYNAAGERISFVDRAGGAHVYSYDGIGRMIEDKVGTFASSGPSIVFSNTMRSGVATGIKRLTWTYDSAGRLSKATSWSSQTGTSTSDIVNEVQRIYTGFGQIATEYQAVFGAVNTSTTPKVSYTYISPTDSSLMSAGIGVLPFTLTYPDGRAIVYSYDNYLDRITGRPTAIGDVLSTGVQNPSTLTNPWSTPTASSTYLEEYKYLGLGTVVERIRAGGDSKLTYVASSGTGDAGDQYTGLDRFGRIVDQRWVKISTGADLDRYQYAYDRNSNPIGKINTLNTGLGEKYTYDDLNRLTAFSQGTVAFSGSTVTVSNSQTGQSWALDALGNWAQVLNTVGGTTTTQTRTYDRQNRFTSSSFTYDDNGNLTSERVGITANTTYTYDSWNRLASAVKTGSGSYSKSYVADALGRRSLDGGMALYYSTDWQVLEERTTSGTNVASGATAQNVFSTVYVDAFVTRERDVTGSTSGSGRKSDGTLSGGLEERTYYQNDANFNVTSLVNTSGTVVERNTFSPYGEHTVRNATTWAAVSGNTSAVSNLYLHQGGRRDAATGLHAMRYRDYAAWLGRWIQQDPARYVDGGNLYSFVRSSPIHGKDPSGLADDTGGGGGNVYADVPPTPPLIAGRGYFKASLTTKNKNDGTIKDVMASDFIAEFYPVKGCGCLEIKFMQYIKETRAGAYFRNGSTSGFVIDDGKKSDTNKQPAWYPYQTPWVPGKLSAMMNDSPSWGGTYIYQAFIVFAICTKGREANNSYGSLEWGHLIDSDNNIAIRWIDGNVKTGKANVPMAIHK